MHDTPRHGHYSKLPFPRLMKSTSCLATSVLLDVAQTSNHFMNAAPLGSRFLLRLIVCIIVNSIIVNSAVNASEPTPTPTSYWTVLKGHQCKGINGYDSDLQRDWNGTAAECKENCIDLGVDCVGFVRVNVGADEHEGNCYFRSTELSDISEYTNDDRDCFVRNAFCMYIFSHCRACYEPN